MSDQTNMPYADSVINFWSGCTPVGIGCDNCWARRLSERWPGKFGQWGKDKPRKWHEGAVKMALRLNKKPWVCECGVGVRDKDCNAAHYPPKAQGSTADCFPCRKCSFHRRRIFVNDLSDWLDPEVSVKWRIPMLDTVRQCDQVVWLFLTKRPQWFEGRVGEVANFIERMCPLDSWVRMWAYEGEAPPNLWIGGSASTQADLDKIVPDLLRIPAKVRWLSLEPLLGPINLMGLPSNQPARIDWVVVGGESGPGHRTCKVEWIADIVMQCRTVGAPVWVKQDSDPRPGVQGRIPAELWNVKEFPKL